MIVFSSMFHVVIIFYCLLITCMLCFIFVNLVSYLWLLSCYLYFIYYVNYLLFFCGPHLCILLFACPASIGIMVMMMTTIFYNALRRWSPLLVWWYSLSSMCYIFAWMYPHVWFKPFGCTSRAKVCIQGSSQRHWKCWGIIWVVVP